MVSKYTVLRPKKLNKTKVFHHFGRITTKTDTYQRQDGVWLLVTIR
jgi:hypothetical protein